MRSMKSTVERMDVEELLKILGEKSPVGVCIIQDGRFSYANPSFPLITGYTADELVGKDSLEIVVPEDKEMVRENAIKMLKGKLTTPYQFRVICKDGSSKWLTETVRPIQYRGRPATLGNYMDITDLKQAEEKLKESEHKYRLLFETSLDYIVQMDREGRYIAANPATARSLGVPLEEMIGKTIFEVQPQKVAQYRLGMVRKALDEWRPQIFEDERAGRYFHHIYIPTKISEQREVVQMIARDITDRRKMEEALRQSEERYRTILEEMEDAYFEVDLGGHFTFVNSSTCRQLGYSKEELMGMSYKKITLEDDIESVFRIFNEVYRTGKANKSCLWTIVCKDGIHRLTEHSALPIRNDKGEIIGFRGVGRDITKRKKAEEALRQSEEKYRVLFDSTVIGTIVLDAETMKVVMVNQAAAKMFGFSSVREAIGINPFDFIFPEDKERFFELAKKNFFEQESRQINELRVVTKDGREIWISATGAKIMHEGRLAGLISFTDITEQKRQNERLMMTDRLASIGELGAGAAHELNNPLTSIMGFSQLLIEKEVPDDIREELKLIYKEAQRAADVTKNLLTFARKHAPVKQLTQINDIIEDMLKLRAYEHEVNSIEVKKKLAPDIPEIIVDSFQMEQVFMNIIINAEYFMIKAHMRGTLTITTKGQDNIVMISIADDGPGIPPENLKRIFDPFFTTKEVGKGTGLGLSICHGIVIEHGGQIYAKSELGKGATIFVELPVNSP